MSDYAAVVISAMDEGGSEYMSTDYVSKITKLPLPTVGKILHRLTSENIVCSLRGRSGGYRLVRHLSEITIIEILEIFEGPIVLTDCTDNSGEKCVYLSNCNIAGKWEVLSSTIKLILENLTLEDLFNSNNNKDIILNTLQLKRKSEITISNNTEI